MQIKVKMRTFKTTKEISEKYNVSRQTINTWIKSGVLEKPKKDFRNWYTWGERDENNLDKIIRNKTIENNKCNDENKERDNSVNISNRRYLGAKSKLLDFIFNVMQDKLDDINIVADVFAGTGVVADMFANLGKKVIINDILKSNFVSYKTWFGNEEVDINRVQDIIKELNSLNPKEDNYVSINYGNKYFTNENAKKIGAIREKIDSYELNERERAFLLTSLIYAIDKVANTVGHYDAFRKTMDSFQDLRLKIPTTRENIENEGNEIYCEDANKLVKNIKADLVYIDTPYNSRQYGDAYHLLENIVEWKKPRLEGVAMKMADRSKTKSAYSLKKAPEVFDDLIQNINSKYILVSYNNMAKKGNGRSNAKISNEEIITSLEKRGKVTIYEVDFSPFTTGKTKIENHKELLYLCEVDNKKVKFYGLDNKENLFIKSAMNYTGGKGRLLKQIIPLFPKKINSFYDLFAGGANVAINVKANNIVINDKDKKLIDMYRVFRKYETKYLILKIEKIISAYKLSNTKEYGYNYYSANSSNGLKNINEENYLKLRNDLNNGLFKNDDYYIALYVLIVYAFNNQIRFNGKGEYNMPPGKRDFNFKMENKLMGFKKAISKENVMLTSKDFRDFKDIKYDKDDFVYLDPPYILSTATYNENGGWLHSDDVDLFNFLDKLNKNGVKFALSNVLKHKGKNNEILDEWSQKYFTHFLNFNYDNSNYQKKEQTETIEVLITNYQ